MHTGRTPANGEYAMMEIAWRCRIFFCHPLGGHVTIMSGCKP
jgi:hypothetical protein